MPVSDVCVVLVIADMKVEIMIFFTLTVLLMCIYVLLNLLQIYFICILYI